MQHKNFFMVPNRIFDLELKLRDFAVYCCLLRHSNSQGRLLLSFAESHRKGVRYG